MSTNCTLHFEATLWHRDRQTVKFPCPKASPTLFFAVQLSPVRLHQITVHFLSVNSCDACRNEDAINTKH